MNKKILPLIFLTSVVSLNAGKLQKIDEDEILKIQGYTESSHENNPIVNFAKGFRKKQLEEIKKNEGKFSRQQQAGTSTDSDIQISDRLEIKKEPVKKKEKFPKDVFKVDKSIRYDSEMEKYSVLEHNKEEFKKILGKTPKLLFKKMFGSSATEKSTYLTAIAYDYGFKKPGKAAYFYDKAKPPFFEVNKLSKIIRIADFYLRTGNPEKIKTLLSEGRCLSIFSISKRSLCNYYIGVAKFLESGELNSALFSASKKIPKAKEIIQNKGL